MRKLIVCNITSLDGKYAGSGNNVMVLPMDGAFDAYNLERLRAATTLLYGGDSYPGFQSYWPSVQHDQTASAVNRELSERLDHVDKMVVSDRWAARPVPGPWRDTATFVSRAEAPEAIAGLKAEGTGEILMFGSHVLWNHLLTLGLVDELHFVLGSMIVGEDGVPIMAAGTRLTALSARTMDGSGNLLVRYAPASGENRMRTGARDS